MHPVLVGNLRAAAALVSLVTPGMALDARQSKIQDPDLSTSAIRIPNTVMANNVRRALRRAFPTLANPECQRIFREFSDEAGRPLQETLDTTAQDGRAHLASLLFYDGSALPRCRSPYTYAVTQPGSRVVFVCATQFARLSERQPRVAAAVLIHEQLHALGLGENPPTSSEITARIIMRCAP